MLSVGKKAQARSPQKWQEIPGRQKNASKERFLQTITTFSYLDMQKKSLFPVHNDLSSYLAYERVNIFRSHCFFFHLIGITEDATSQTGQNKVTFHGRWSPLYVVRWADYSSIYFSAFITVKLSERKMPKLLYIVSHIYTALSCFLLETKIKLVLWWAPDSTAVSFL